jgi:hypothetical protein
VAVDGGLKPRTVSPRKSSGVGVTSAGTLQPVVAADDLAEIDLRIWIVAYFFVRHRISIGPGYAGYLPFITIRRGYGAVFANLEIAAALDPGPLPEMPEVP